MLRDIPRLEQWHSEVWWSKARPAVRRDVHKVLWLDADVPKVLPTASRGSAAVSIAVRESCVGVLAAIACALCARLKRTPMQLSKQGSLTNVTFLPYMSFGR